MANPIFIPVPFALNGTKNTIQKELQPTQDLEDATWNAGWGNITMIPKEDGGLAPKGQDFNGVFYSLSDHIVHRQNGQQIQFNAGVVSEYGGYAAGSIIQSDDLTRHYRSLIDNNTFNPNTDSITGRWEIYMGQGSIPNASSTVAGLVKVLNTLNSTDSGSALSAAQGKVLGDRTQQAEVNNVGVARFATLPELIAKSSLPIMTRPSDIAYLIDTTTIGIGQTNQNLTGSRALGGTYTNNTGRPITIRVYVRNYFGGISSEECTLFVNNFAIPFAGGGLDTSGALKAASITWIIQPNETYRVTSQTGGTLFNWTERR